MYLCKIGHDEVCYNGGDCPVCAVEKEKDSEIDLLNAEIEEHKETIQGLESEIRTGA